MMMASDSSQTPSSRLDDATLEALRAALSQYLIDDTSSNQLREVLMRVATEARERAILPEHVLIALKNVWSALPEVRNTPATTQQIRLLQRVVTMCIKEYYSS
jgi:hemoglobin-like flavoprotein